jgi:hypothetical protein
LGIARGFPGFESLDSTSTVEYNGFLSFPKSANWWAILFGMPFAAWLTPQFIVVVETAVKSLDRVLVAEGGVSPFSERYGTEFRFFWRWARALVPLVCFGLIVITEHADWFSPIRDYVDWGDRDWSVAIRSPDHAPWVLLLLFNTLAFWSEGVLTTLAVLALCVAAHIAFVFLARSFNKQHWLRQDYDLDWDRPGAQDAISDLRLVVTVYFAYMTFALFVCLFAVHSNVRESKTGLDGGTGCILAFIVFVPAISTIYLGIANRSLLQNDRDSDDEQRDQPRPLSKFTWLLFTFNWLLVAVICVVAAGGPEQVWNYLVDHSFRAPPS